MSARLLPAGFSPEGARGAGPAGREHAGWRLGRVGRSAVLAWACSFAAGRGAYIRDSNNQSTPHPIVAYRHDVQMLASAWIERRARDVQKETATDGVRHRNGTCRGRRHARGTPRVFRLRLTYRERRYPQSARTTPRSELLTFTPLASDSMKSSFLNLFMKKLTRRRVVPTISDASVCPSSLCREVPDGMPIRVAAQSFTEPSRSLRDRGERPGCCSLYEELPAINEVSRHGTP